MGCGPVKKVFLLLLLVTLVAVIYKHQTLLEVSVEMRSKNVTSMTHFSAVHKIHTETVNESNSDGLILTVPDILNASLAQLHAESSTERVITTHSIASDYNFIEVDPHGDFLKRVELYNDAIINIRRELQEKRGYKPWQDIHKPLDVLWCNRDDFMDVLKNYSHVKTVRLKWRVGELPWSSLSDRSNIVIKNYYKWTATEPLCKWIETPGYTKARWDAVYNRTCNTDMGLASKVTSIEPVYFHGKPINKRDYWPNEGFSYPPYFYTTYPDKLIYMHIIEDAIILETGDVISNNLKLVPYGCSQDIDPRPPPDYNKSIIYSEVFLVSQFWGSAFFHSMIEGLPRIAAYLKFLLDNPSVLIHVERPTKYIQKTLIFLGLNPERLVSFVARAKVLYVPQATPCGFAQIHELQLLNHLYTSKLEELHPSASNNSTVIFIRRSGQRQFRDNRGVEEAVARAAQDFNLPFITFRDDPSPSMEEAMKMFYSAALVVAPHGAGLSNVVYSRPGTYVVEGVCNEPHVNMCYQWTCHILGHRYHAIPSRGGCEAYIDIDPVIMDLAVRTFLQQLKWT